MGEARRKAAKANDEKIIEASEQERFCLVQFFGRAGQSGCVEPPQNRQDQRRYDRLFEDFDLDAIEQVGIQRARANPDTFQISHLSGELEEFTTTLDVIEYVTKATDTKIAGGWIRPILRVVERMLGCKEGTYKAPSVLAAEADTATPALAAVPEDKAV
jgi:hypothetical protein